MTKSLDVCLAGRSQICGGGIIAACVKLDRGVIAACVLRRVSLIVAGWAGGVTCGGTGGVTCGGGTDGVTCGGFIIAANCAAKVVVAITDCGLG